jgi:hypothetical protein
MRPAVEVAVLGRGDVDSQVASTSRKCTEHSRGISPRRFVAPIAMGKPTRGSENFCRFDADR